MIDFLLNGQPRHCEASPDTSVLELLRETLGQTGTKEGCASGDCGACTVAIGEAGPDGRVHYHSANACITPAHQLQGLSLVTVEGLARGEALHPAQAAMVACHASQCGFCTPGIVMSLFTLHEAQQQRPAPLTPERLEAALGGNLCRCTGYRPIRDAALSMGEHPYARPEWLDLAVDATAPIQEPAADSAFVQPTTLDALAEERRRHPEAPIVAGGTDLWLEVTQRLRRFARLVDVTRVAELTTIEETTLDDDREGWWIGGAVTYSRLEPLLEEHYPAFPTCCTAWAPLRCAIAAPWAVISPTPPPSVTPRRCCSPWAHGCGWPAPETMRESPSANCPSTTSSWTTRRHLYARAR